MKNRSRLQRLETGSRRAVEMSSLLPGATINVCVLSDGVASAQNATGFIHRISDVANVVPRTLRVSQEEIATGDHHLIRLAAKADLLIVARQTDDDLPDCVKEWLAAWLKCRAPELEGALVALVANKYCAPDKDSPLVAHLETFAAVGNLAFFGGCVGLSASTHLPKLPRKDLLDDADIHDEEIFVKTHVPDELFFCEHDS